MKIKTLPITHAIEITDAPGLDPIRVILQDFGDGRGRLILSCFGQAWENYWPGMGNRTLREFLLAADVEYIVGALSRAPHLIRKKPHEQYLARIIGALKTALVLDTNHPD